MRKSIHLFLLLISCGCFLAASAQTDDFFYSITDLQKDGNGWNALRKVDITTGEYSTVILNGSNVNTPVFDAVTRQPYNPAPDPKYGNYAQAPFSTGVAAIAYDRKNERVWFTPMFIDQLRYVDLKTMQVFYVTGKPFTGLGNMHNDESKIITRMVIAPDGTGYAISNDGNTFLRFSTNKKKDIEIENLGRLTDDKANGDISIHARASSFGGDVIADDDGHLYIVSALNHVFKISIPSGTATHLGVVSNLPDNFTTNGLAVTTDGKIIASSAVSSNAWALIDPSGWKASFLTPSTGAIRSSDLANGNYLVTKKNQPSSGFLSPEAAIQTQIMIYPNPVINKKFTLDLKKLEKGDYEISLSDISGKVVQKRQISIGGEGQVEKFSLKEQTASGVYLVNVTDKDNKIIFTQKLMVQ